MASLKAKHVPIPHDERGDARRDGGNGGVAAKRFEPGRARTRFDFGTRADPAEEYWRATGVLVLVAITVIGAIGTLTYFAGFVAAAVVATALATLIGFGNWVLNSTIDLL